MDEHPAKLVRPRQCLGGLLYERDWEEGIVGSKSRPIRLGAKPYQYLPTAALHMHFW